MISKSVAKRLVTQILNEDVGTKDNKVEYIESVIDFIKAKLNELSDEGTNKEDAWSEIVAGLNDAIGYLDPKGTTQGKK